MDFFKYFGTPIKARSEMLKDLEHYLDGHNAYSVKKEILHAEENVRVGDILKIEQVFIKSLSAKNPSLGYNR